MSIASTIGAYAASRAAATSPAVVPSGPPRPSAATAPATTPRVEVWDMSSGVEQPVAGAEILKGSDSTLKQAYDQATKVDTFLRETLGRNGWDDKGSPLRVVVHALDEDGTANMNNAFWHGETQRVYLGDGDGKQFAPLGGALDVLVHETAHAVVDSELNIRYEGRQGGITESWADVLAALADPDDWQIGEDVFTPGVDGDSIRDLEHPRYGHVDQLPKDQEVPRHELSGVPSLAAVRVAGELGREQMGRIWYSALVDHMDPRAGFPGAARATLEAAAQLHGRTSSEVGAVLAAWKSVGVEPRWKP